VKKTLLFIATVMTLMTALSLPTIVQAEDPYCPIGVKCT
jgi:hypothetical protein